MRFESTSCVILAIIVAVCNSDPEPQHYGSGRYNYEGVVISPPDYPFIRYPDTAAPNPDPDLDSRTLFLSLFSSYLSSLSPDITTTTTITSITTAAPLTTTTSTSSTTTTNRISTSTDTSTTETTITIISTSTSISDSTTTFTAFTSTSTSTTEILYTTVSTSLTRKRRSLGGPEQIRSSFADLDDRFPIASPAESTEQKSSDDSLDSIRQSRQTDEEVEPIGDSYSLNEALNIEHTLSGSIRPGTLRNTYLVSSSTVPFTTTNAV